MIHFIKFILPFAMFLFFYCSDVKYDCPNLLTYAAKFELIDSVKNQHIIEAIIYSYSENDTIILNPFKDNTLKSLLEKHDSIYRIHGNPGIYSFKISCSGYKDTSLTNIKIDYLGDPKCNQPKERSFRIKLHNSK